MSSKPLRSQCSVGCDGPAQQLRQKTERREHNAQRVGWVYGICGRQYCPRGILLRDCIIPKISEERSARGRSFWFMRACPRQNTLQTPTRTATLPW